MKRAIQNFIFSQVHSRNLVYNTCWEDPRLDREALELSSSDTVLVITSAGCNALDYALAGAGKIIAIDVNPRQNALLELKIAAARVLDYEGFFAMFGTGRVAKLPWVYHRKIRKELPDFARAFWDQHYSMFSAKPEASGFYFRGSAGFCARLVNWYIDYVAKARPLVREMMQATCAQQQRSLYFNELKPQFWKQSIQWILRRNSYLSGLGVPPAQRDEVEQSHPRGLLGFVEDALDAVFGSLPLHDNYFYRVYLDGKYSHDCCPEYLKEQNFPLLREVSSRIRTFNGSVAAYLENHEEPISKFVLLDHMDWMAGAGQGLLQREWRGIINRAQANARIIWRSGGTSCNFLRPLKVPYKGNYQPVLELLRFDKEKADKLHSQDRVHTYGSFYIANLAA